MQRDPCRVGALVRLSLRLAAHRKAMAVVSVQSVPANLWKLLYERLVDLLVNSLPRHVVVEAKEVLRNGSSPASWPAAGRLGTASKEFGKVPPLQLLQLVLAARLPWLNPQ